mmetsp:Transcript_15710/g.20744  ORF Transcript_15710/g.20744 Transcript_15710/m.20744 type:complete len:159 (-) Transcript_15710:401-877(-)
MNSFRSIEIEKLEREIQHIPACFFNELDSHFRYELQMFLRSVVKGDGICPIEVPLGRRLFHIIRNGNQVKFMADKFTHNDFTGCFSFRCPEVRVVAKPLVPSINKFRKGMNYEIANKYAVHILGAHRAGYNFLKLSFDHDYHQIVNKHIFEDFISKDI